MVFCGGFVLLSKHVDCILLIFLCVLPLEASFSLWLRNVIPSIFINIISLYF